jgi:drug/metabolite transporter (DMT)-like permease
VIQDLTEKAPISEYALLLLLAALWGGAFTLIEVALGSFEPMTIVSTRVMIGGAILVAIAALRGDAFPKTSKRWGELAVQGVLQGGLPFYLITWAEIHIDSSVAGVINSTPPMFVFLITVFLLRTEKFDTMKFAGILFCMTGVGVIAIARWSGGGDTSSSLALLAVLAASCSYAMGAIYGRRFGQQSVFVTGGVSLLLAGLIVTPAALAFESPFSVSPELAPTLALLALALFSTALASLIFFRLLKTIGSLATTSNAYLRALFSMLLGSVFLGEDMGLPILAATLCIFMGVFLMTGQFRRILYNRLRAKASQNA